MRAESGELLKILSIRVLDLAVILVGFVIWGGGGGRGLGCVVHGGSGAGIVIAVMVWWGGIGVVGAIYMGFDR